ncbi:MAG: CPBP family intramembrane glutamic endopeptidase [Phycisphaerae bacterium]
MSRRSASSAAAAPTEAASDAGPLAVYFNASERPLAALVFLAPFVVFYELGTVWFATDPAAHTQQRIIAFNLLSGFFALFGAHGRFLPAAAVVAILLAWHLMRQDRWHLTPGVPLGMLLESVLLAIPLVFLGWVMNQYLPIAAPFTGQDAKSLLVLAIGAGIYEELVFRLIGLTALVCLFEDVLGVSAKRAAVISILISAVAFSAYHHLGPEPWNWRAFSFRALAGVWFGWLFIARGFGVTAGSHAAYDVMIVLVAQRPLS